MAKRIKIIPVLDTKTLFKQLKRLGNRKQTINVNVNGSGINNTVQQLHQMNSAGNTSTSVFGKLKSVIKDTFSEGKIVTTAYLAVLNMVYKAGAKAKEAIEDIDESITNISVATNLSRKATADLVGEYNQYARELKATTKDVTDAADDWLRAGKTMEEAKELIKDSTMLSKLGQIAPTEATEDLLATMNGYELSVQQTGEALDAMVAIDMRAATSAGDLATGLKYSASSAYSAGVSLNKLLGILGAVQDKTQQTSQVVGTFANTLLSRYRDITIGKYLTEDGEDISNYEATLKSIGISLRDSKGEFRSFETVLEEMANKWDTLSSVQQNALIKVAAGTRQQNRFIALMEGYNKVLELTEVAANSAGTAIEKYNNSYADSLEAKQNELQASFEALIMNNDFSQVYGDIIDATTALVDFINKTNALKGVATSLAVAGFIKGFLSIRTGINEAYISLNQFHSALDLVQKQKLSTKEFDRLLLLTNKLSESQTRVILSSKNLSIRQKEQILVAQGLSKEEAKLKLQTLGLTNAQTGLTASTVSLKNAAKGLLAYIAANPLTVLLTAISTASMVFSSYKNHLEELRQTAQDGANAYKESASSIDDYVAKYQDLRQALIEAKGNEEETYNVKQQLLSLQNELNNKFGEEYGKLNLVTDAYKDQTEAIKSYNRESAKTFLNENREGIQTATKQMTKTREYTLSDNGISLDTASGKAINDIVQKYSDKGMSLLDSGAGTYQVVIKADAENAYEAINDFSNDLRERSKELGNEHLFDGILNISSKALNDAKSVVEDYSNIYKQALMAELVSDDGMSSLYSEALNAVEQYNNAITGSTDLYSDENVANAKKNLDEVRAKIDGNLAEWGKYSSITNALFEQADTKLLDFNNELTSNKELIKDAMSLKKYDNLDLQSLNPGENEAFDRLKVSADDYGLSVEQLIDALVRLGYVQGEVINAQSEFGESIENSKSKMIDLINSMSDGFDILDKIYADVVDGGAFDFTNLDSKKFKDAFSGLEDEYTNFIEKVSASPNNIKACQEAFNELTTAYINHKGVLDNLTEDNKQLAISMLKNMGVSNAEEIVLAQLAVQTELAALEAYDLANATYAEAEEFINGVTASEEAKQALAQLALEKINVNENKIDTSSDIDQIISLANTALASASALSQLAKAKSVLSAVESAGSRERAGISEKAYQDALKTVDAINNGTFDYGYQKIDANKFKVTSNPKYTPKYSGGTDTAKAKEAQKKAKETFDYFERRIEVLNQSISKLEAGMENVIGADAKNTLLSAQIGIVDEEIRNYTDALGMYRQKADEALSGIDASLRDKIVNGAIEITDFIGENSSEVVETMNNYKKWADKIASCTSELEALKTQIRQLELQKFSNIISDFTNQFDIYENSNDLLEAQIKLLEESGQLIGDSYFTKQIEQNQKQLNILQEEKARLMKQLNDALDSGRITAGSDEWLSMVNSLKDVEKSIIDVKTEIESLDNQLLELNYKVFERIQTEFSNIGDELKNLVGLFDEFNDIKVTDGNGNWTNEAITTLGLYAQQYELARYQAAQYAEQIEKLNQEYLNGRYSATEYSEKLASLKQEQWNCINTAHDLEDAIISLNKSRVDEEIEGIDKEIEKYRELIQAQIDALDAEKDLNDYKKSIADKTASITKLEKEIAAMQNDTSAKAKALRLKKEEELAKAKQDLQDAEYEHSVTQQKDALNKQYEDYEKSKNDEIEALKLNLENKEQLISDSLEIVKQNTAMIGQQIALIAQEHGITVSNAVITPWTQGENAIASYGETLSTQSSAFIGNLMGVENEVYNLQTEANTASVAISNMFGQRADTLNSELVASYVAEDNLNTMTGILQNSLINTLEGGYNVSGITSAMGAIASSADSVAEAANRATQALAEMLGAQAQKTSVETSIGKKGTTYNVKDIYSGEVLKSFSNYNDAYAYWQKLNDPNQKKKTTVSAFSKGGIISNKDSGDLDFIAKDLGEDHTFVGQNGEAVIPKESVEKNPEVVNSLINGKTLKPEEAFYVDGVKYIPYESETMTKLAEYMKKNDFSNSFSVPMLNQNVSKSQQAPDVVPKQQPNVTLHYDNLINIGSFTDGEHMINAIEKTAKKVTKGMLDDINRDFRLRH